MFFGTRIALRFVERWEACNGTDDLYIIRRFLTAGGLPADIAKVAELADALDLGSSGVTRGSSSLPFRTNVSRPESLGPVVRNHIEHLKVVGQGVVGE